MGQCSNVTHLSFINMIFWKAWCPEMELVMNISCDRKRAELVLFIKKRRYNWFKLEDGYGCM
jgi:hypothetical protein